MSYTVLARRYRSGTFDEVIGQDHVAQTLKKAIASGRIAHAYLFCGTRGVGKTSMARILAKALNCHKSDGPTTEPCGKCQSCVAIARGDDIDVIEIDAASNTGVDNVRDVIENSQYRPANSRFKIYIIDEAHMLSKQAFNALLKTLEEPPSHVKFILATTEAEKLLPTILSRCQRYDFRNIPTREIADHLADLCKREKVKADEDALLLVAKAGAGSMRDSLSLLDRLLSIGEKNLTAEMIEQLLGLPKSQLLFDLAKAIGGGDVKAVLGQANAMVQAGLSVDSLIVALVDHLRNLLILRTCGPDSTLVEVPGIAMKDLMAQAGEFDAGILAQDITILEELRRTLRQSQAGRALLDATLVRLTLADQFASIGDLLSRLDGGGGMTKGQPSSAPAAGQKKNLIEPVVNATKEVAAASSGSLSAVPEGKGGDKEPVGDMPTSQSAASPQPSPLSTGESEPDNSNAANAIAPQAAADASASPTTAETAAVFTVDTDDDDDLPAVGKVWEGGSESLSTLMAKHRAASASASATAPVASPAPAAPPASVAPPAPSDAGPSDVEAVDVENLPAVWQAMLDLLASHGPMLHSLISQGKLVGIEDDRVVLRFSPQNETFIKQWEKNGKRDLIRDTASKALNRNIGVKFEIEADTTPAAEAPKAAPTQSKRAPAAPAPAPVMERMPEAQMVKITSELVEELAKNSPVIRSVMQKLGGQVVKVE